MGMGQIIDYSEFILQIEKAVANGVATLDSGAKVPKTQISLTASDVGALSSESDPTVPTFAKGLTSASDVLAAIKTVDGLNSGLDADLIRGINPSTFLTSETDPTVTSYTKTLTSNDVILTAVNAASGTISTARLPNELSALQALADTAGFLKKTGDGTYSIDTATYLTANQSITISGDASGSGSTSITLTLANSGVVAGTYNALATQVRPFDVDSKGRITGVGSPVTITPAWSSITSKPTTLSGLGVDISSSVTGILGVANGGTATNGFTNGHILFGNGITNIGTSSRLYWDNTNKYLAVRSTGAETPAYPLDVFGGSRVSGVALFTNTTSSTSSTTGGAVFSGGVGVAGNLYIGGDFSFVGDILGGTIRTWTPTLGGETTEPTVTYSVQNGEYVRVGRLIVANFYINYSSFTGGSGKVKVSLPIATKTPAASWLALSCTSFSDDATIQKTVPRLAGASLSYCFLRKNDSAADLLISELPATCYFIGCLAYLV